MENATLQYIIRDHSAASFEARENTLKHIEKTMNEKYGQGTVKLEIHEQYRNMIEKVAPCMQLVDYAKDAIRELGMEPNTCLLYTSSGRDLQNCPDKGLLCTGCKGNQRRSRTCPFCVKSGLTACVRCV